MEEERFFVAFAFKDEDGDLQTIPARLTQEQLNLLFWLDNNNLLNGKYERYNPDYIMRISEP